MDPYKNDAMNKIYDLLFCDQIDLYRTSGELNDEYPGKVLFDPDAADASLRSIIDDESVETRFKLIAANLLAARGNPYGSRRIYGVIVEVGMDEGLDVLAAYDDGTARYINYSEKLIVWDTKTAESSALVADLFSAAQSVVDQIGPWEGNRLPPPVSGNARLTFLVSDGLYFGEGPFEMLAGDPMGGAVINSAAKLMGFLVENALDQSP